MPDRFAAAIVASMILGAIAGYAYPPLGPALAVVSTIFLRLIRSVIAPLLFGVLVTAVAGAGGRALGRLGLRAVIYFEIVSALALLLGWATVTLGQPGVGARIAGSANAARSVSAGTVVEQAFPSSVFDAMARGDVLQTIVFCILFGAAAGAVGAKAAPVLRFCEGLTAVSFQFTRYVMYLAPPAVFAAMAGMTAEGASETALALGRFVALAWIAQTLYTVVVIGASLRIAGVSWSRFAREVREPFFVAFATTSSAAALPQALDAVKRLGVPALVSGIVTPLSVSFNLGGSCIHLAMGAFFVAQAAGIGLSWSQQALILATLKLTSKGVAGIPRANFVILTGLFGMFGLPLEGLTLLLGVDALIDPVRTSVNVLGHCAAPAVVARFDDCATVA